MSAAVLTVSQVNNYVKMILDEDDALRSIFVVGEISNFKDHYASGHLYFSLKDTKSGISCVMFAGNASRLRFKPKDGMKVIVRGSVSLYPANGQYQLYIESMQPDGTGAIALAYEQLKEKLSAEGLFAESHKKPLPVFPKTIGVVTSETGAVIEDIKRVTSERCPLAEIVLYPSAVQGESAPLQLTEGINYFNSEKNVDVIIIGRGGGSMEDLFCFNDERLVRAIYACTIPVISAVGHETDFTLCDLVADRRASTPSNAAEIAVPSKEEQRHELSMIRDRIKASVGDILYTSYQDIDRLKDSVEALRPERIIEKEMLSVKLFESRMMSSVENRLVLESARTDALADSLNALSPVRLLQKGYSVAFKNEKCVSSVSELDSGDKIKIRFSDGYADCTVESAVKTEV